MPTVYLALGSNLGDRAAHIENALRQLESVVALHAVSAIYETEPWGLRDQPWFLNVVCAGETNLLPHALLAAIKTIERQMGRRSTVRYGPRPIDIDILFYASQIINTDRLQIPHPRLAERAFVLVPLAEIAPNLRHPVTGLSPDEMLSQLGKSGVVRRYRGRG